MNASVITRLRLHQQQLSAHKFKTVKELVTHMGVLQAQDETMCKWAVGIRLKGAELETVETAFDKGDIFRTHVLRPTWHLVAAQDIHWMLKLTAPNVQRLMKSRLKELELTPAVLTKTRKLLEKLLADADYITRNELHEAFTRAKIHTADNRLAHILYSAEIEGLIASGPLHKGKHTYALLDKRVKKAKEFSRDTALAELAHRYFNSHGPATLQDFAWWSGLSQKDARQGLEDAKKNLAEEKSGEAVYYMAKNLKAPAEKKNAVYFLPAFDEYLISYRDRSAALEKQNQAHAFSTNGIFYPVVIVNGQVTGTWKRSFKKDEVIVGTKFFDKPSKLLMPEIKKAAEHYARFTGKKLV